MEAQAEAMASGTAGKILVKMYHLSIDMREGLSCCFLFVFWK